VGSGEAISWKKLKTRGWNTGKRSRSISENRSKTSLMAERLVGAMSWSAVCGGEILRFVRYEKEVDIPVGGDGKVLMTGHLHPPIPGLTKRSGWKTAGAPVE